MKKLAICSTVLLATLALVAAPLAAQDWAGRGRAHGSVKDENKKPIEGAKITLIFPSSNDGPEPLYTDKKGYWSYLGLAGGIWRVLIDAEGYSPSEGQYAVNEFAPGPPAVITLGRNPSSFIDKGDALLDQGKYAEARTEFQKALSDLDKAPAARLRSRIGDTYYEEGNFEAARAEYEQALPYIAPGEQAHIRLQLANSYQREERWAEARTEFEKVLPLLGPEGQAQVLLTIARGYDLEEKREDAIKTLDKALQLMPDSPELLQVMADLLTRVGREDEARTYLARLPEDATLPSDMVLNIGIRLYNEGDAVKALEYFDRAVQENPNLAETYYYRGLSYLATSENEKAVADFKKLLELEPEGARAAEAQEFLSFLEPEG